MKNEMRSLVELCFKKRERKKRGRMMTISRLQIIDSYLKSHAATLQLNWQPNGASSTAPQVFNPFWHFSARKLVLLVLVPSKNGPRMNHSKAETSLTLRHAPWGAAQNVETHAGCFMMLCTGKISASLMSHCPNNIVRARKGLIITAKLALPCTLWSRDIQYTTPQLSPGKSFMSDNTWTRFVLKLNLSTDSHTSIRHLWISWTKSGAPSLSCSVLAFLDISALLCESLPDFLLESMPDFFKSPGIS